MRLVREADGVRASREWHANCLDELTRFAREVNTELDRGRLAAILSAAIDRMFQARQILVYFTSDEGDALEMEVARGFEQMPRVPQRIPMGSGRIGWVAEQQRTMTREEFARMGRGDPGASDPANDPRPELLSPMVHDGKTVGVIGISGGATDTTDERKRLLRLAADLGSIALRSSVRIAAISSSANFDGLTKLFNRRHFMERLGFEIAAAERAGEPLSIFLFDIDFFKTFNDTNGHPLGDEVLRVTGKLVRDAMGRGQFAGRYGGEEFIVAMPRTALPAGIEAAERLRAIIQKHRYPREESQPTGDLTISGGLAEFPRHARSVPDLIRLADKALYRAKALGRNRVEAYQAADETLVLGAAGRT
jgi:diguanylate cyclase (GGDEF)-like protein